MIPVSESSANNSVPEFYNSNNAFGNMNIEDFAVHGLQSKEGSSSSTPHYIASPAQSGGSASGVNPGNIAAQFSPANYNSSPRNSPSTGLPITSPQHSCPASNNSCMGMQPASPYFQPNIRPQVIAPHHPPMGGHTVSPITTPVGIPQVPYGSQAAAPAVFQSQPTVVSQIPSPIHRVPAQIIKGVTPPTKRSPTVQSTRPARSTNEEIITMPMPKQLPAARGFPPANPVGVPRLQAPKSPSYKIFELNRRLQEHHPQNESAWWDYFASEFFDDNATLSLTLFQADTPKNFTINRVLIPKYFKSFFEGGIVELFFNLRHSKEWFQNSSIIVESEQCAMETIYINPIYTKVLSEGKLTLEFVPDARMRIKSWYYMARQWQEQIPREILSIQAQRPNPALMQEWGMNITRHGFPTTTLNFLRMCCILQPMQQLMTMHKSIGADPRECMQKMAQNWHGAAEKNGAASAAIPGVAAGCQAPKQRKKRKTAAERKEPANSRKKRSQVLVGILPVVDQPDVMIVGEPSRMGGTLEKDDERKITRFDNVPVGLESNGQNDSANTNSTWTLDDVLVSTLPDLDENLRN